MNSLPARHMNLPNPVFCTLDPRLNSMSRPYACQLLKLKRSLLALVHSRSRLSALRVERTPQHAPNIRPIPQPSDRIQAWQIQTWMRDFTDIGTKMKQKDPWCTCALVCRSLSRYFWHASILESGVLKIKSKLARLGKLWHHCCENKKKRMRQHPWHQISDKRHELWYFNWGMNAQCSSTPYLQEACCRHRGHHCYWRCPCSCQWRSKKTKPRRRRQACMSQATKWSRKATQ